MFKPGQISSQAVSLKILRAGQIEEIVQAAFTIVETTGFRISKKEARESLKKAGATISDDLAYVPRAIVQSCLNAAPKGIQIYNRLGELSMQLWGSNVYYGTATASPSRSSPRDCPRARPEPRNRL